ncbi:MAG: mandelate racemase/muconate lactonizing protein, partial [uncultured bacterium]
DGTGVSLIEQPIRAEDWEGLKRLHKTSPVPIIADESVVSFEDARELLSGDYVSGVNVKLMKCGGPTNFIKIFDLAKSLHKTVMLGCMYESNISLTTGANLALGMPIDYVDLDSGPLDFHDDPAVGGMEVRGGEITVERPLDLKPR